MLSSTNQPRKMLEDEEKCKFRGQMDVHGSCCFTSPIAHAKSGTKMVDEVPGTLPLRVGGQSERSVIRAVHEQRQLLFQAPTSRSRQVLFARVLVWSAHTVPGQEGCEAWRSSPGQAQMETLRDN